MDSVSVEGLHKSYGDLQAVVDLSFTVGSGEILGVIGPNGAGKSTTIKMILGFLEPDSGEVRVLGQWMSEQLKNRIGYLPEEKGLYHNDSAIEQIVYLASLKGMEQASAKARATKLLERVGLAESAKKPIKELSKGMGQMIQLIVTIVHEPELIILDEPFSGLDPVNTELLRAMVAELRDNGAAIILSTHQMNQVEEICDRVLMIDHGRSVLYGTVAETTARFRRKSVLVEVDGELPSIPGVSEVRKAKDAVELIPAEGTTPMMILDRLREHELEITRFELAIPSLHEIFLKVVGASDE